MHPYYAHEPPPPPQGHPSASSSRLPPYASQSIAASAPPLPPPLPYPGPADPPLAYAPAATGSGAEDGATDSYGGYAAPLPNVKGDWTTQVPLPLPDQVPPGGSIILPPGTSGLPGHLGGGTEFVKVTAKVRSLLVFQLQPSLCRWWGLRLPEIDPIASSNSLAPTAESAKSRSLRPTWVIPEDDGLPTSSQLRNPFIASSGVNHHQALIRTGSHTPFPPRPDEGSNGSNTVASQRSGGDDNADQSMTRLWENFLQASNLGQSSSDWRLALPTLATSLTVHLIDASMHSCCFHLPAFNVFSPEVNYFKANVDHLDIASQVIVAILTSLGARASPHSALLGVAGPDIENGEGSPDIVLSAGVRRENAWRAIVKRATDLCSSMEILQVPTARNAQTLVAFVQMLMLAEAKPKTARFFLRTAMGIFRDMQHSDLPLEEVRAIKASVGPTLFECDCRIAAYLGMPPLISDDDLYEYFDGTGVHVPDLAAEDLGPELDDILDPAYGQIDRAKLDRALALTGYFVCSVQRSYASIASSRRPSPRFRSAIPALWSAIDRTHSAVQRLHRRLVQLDYVPAGCDLSHSVDYDLLISVRMDERLLDVVHLAHVWLVQLRKIDLTPQDRKALEELLAVSERRVRKCLKLLAFYSKVFYDSLDKHVVYHLFTQLEVLPNWVAMAAQREGEMTEFGPLPSECVLTETELDWFTSALELACFFTPLGATRLRELKTAREARRFPAAGTAGAAPPLFSTYALPVAGQVGVPPERSSSAFQHGNAPSGRSAPSILNAPPVSVATTLSSAMLSESLPPDQPGAERWTFADYAPINLPPDAAAELTGSSDRSSLSPQDWSGGPGSVDFSSSTSGAESAYGVGLPPPPPPMTPLSTVNPAQTAAAAAAATFPWAASDYGNEVMGATTNQTGGRASPAGATARAGDDTHGKLDHEWSTAGMSNAGVRSVAGQEAWPTYSGGGAWQ
ncbi:hypothetical protein JCM8202v2_003280 [Rhodotorula sphaerocarpa]